MTRAVIACAIAVLSVHGVACGGDEALAPGADGGRASVDGGSVHSDGGTVVADGGGVTADGGSVAADGGPAADGGGVTADGGLAADGGSVAADGGTAADGGVAADGGSVAADGGTVADGGVAADGGSVADGGVAADGGVPSNLCGATFASCSSFTDATAAGASRTINFSGTSYSPKCLRIKSGQSVTFSGSFSSHPLEGQCGASDVIGAVSSGTGQSYTLDAVGLYGYYCTFHGSPDGSGMAGAIEVVP